MDGQFRFEHVLDFLRDNQHLVPAEYAFDNKNIRKDCIQCNACNIHKLAKCVQCNTCDYHKLARFSQPSVGNTYSEKTSTNLS